jgi:hypothetical protein
MINNNKRLKMAMMIWCFLGKDKKRSFIFFKGKLFNVKGLCLVILNRAKAL